VSNVNFITINLYFYQSIGQVNILVQFGNTEVSDIYNRPITMSAISYAYGPYLKLLSASDQKTIQSISNTANSII
jgi:hypothetical protein